MNILPIKANSRPRWIAAGWAVAALLIAANVLPAATVVAKYYLPDNSSGLAYDGGRFWFGGIGTSGGIIRSFDPDRGAVVDTIAAPAPECFGLDWLEGALIYISPNSDSTWFVSPDGSLSAFSNPYHNMAGLGSDGMTIWSSSYFSPAKTLIQMDADGHLISATPFLGRHCRDFAYHDGLLYAADRVSHLIRVLNPETGRSVSSFETPGANPSGLASDGQFLWLLDDGDKVGFSTLYKLEVRDAGGGIRFSELSHNFGSVVIDQNKTWSVWVYNDGLNAAKLIHFDTVEGNDDIFVPHLWSFPESISAGDSAKLEISFQPAYLDSAHIIFAVTYDLDRIANQIDLRGKGVRATRQISISERNLAFGRTRMGQDVRSSNLRYLMVESTGGEALTIEKLTFSNQSFFAGLYQFPVTFDEPGMYPIPIFFRPLRQNNIYGTLKVYSDDPDASEIEVTLAGIGQLDVYPGGRLLWSAPTGDPNGEHPRVRALCGVNDISGDGLSDVIAASNDYLIRSFHAASTTTALTVWTYNTGTNPWRSGLVYGDHGLSIGGDWNADGVRDVVAGLAGDAMDVIALSGLTGERMWTFDTHGHRWGGGRVRSVDGSDDMDGDGNNDVVAIAAESDASHATNALWMLDGPSGEAQWIYELDSPPKFMRTIPDVTGDHLPDIIVLCEDGTVVAVEGRLGRFIWKGEVSGDTRDMTTIEDVNGDGSYDLAIISLLSGIWMFNGSNGELLWHTALGEPEFNLRYLTKVTALNDVNGNGTPDLVIGDAQRYTWGIDGWTHELAWWDPMITGSEVLSLATLADLDHDGVRDFAVGTAGGRLYVVSGTGNFGIWSYTYQGGEPGFEIVRGVHDVDGNGQMDVVSAMSNGTVGCFAGNYIGDHDTTNHEWVSDPPLPESLTLQPAFPNPFNSSVNIPINLPHRGAITLTVFDLLGRQIYSRQTPSLSAGSHYLFWNGAYGASPVPSGTYTIRVSSESGEAESRVTLVR